MKNISTREIILVVGFGITALILGVKVSKQSKEIKNLKAGMSSLNNLCDKKNMVIGKILTEIKVKN